MLERTYKRVESLNDKYNGYIDTRELLKEGITNRQINVLVQEGILEKIAYGHYWLAKAPYEKPDNYKVIETCICNPAAVICADSACYYQGLIDVEPPVLSVATRRGDRQKMPLNFPIKRHYYAEATFAEKQSRVETKFGVYQIYDIDRSVCDCIRFQKDIQGDIFDLVIENYRKNCEGQRERILAYARAVRAESQVQRILF